LAAAILKHLPPNYEEYLDSIEDEDSAKHKQHYVCEAIHKK
jgi:hypothetical protein